MKKVLLMITFIVACLHNNAQSDNMPAGNMIRIVGGLSYSDEYLISANGKYKFFNSETGGKRWIILKNLLSGEVLFSFALPKSLWDDAGAGNRVFVFLRFNKLAEFKEFPCAYNPAIKCEELTAEKSTYLPMISALYYYPNGAYSFFADYSLNFGEPDAYQGSWENGSHQTKIPVPLSQNIFVKQTNGIYTARSTKLAAQLKLLNDGNLVILNSTGQVLWESYTGEQQLINNRNNKRFYDLTTNLENDLFIASPGDVILSNTSFGQSKAKLELVAKNYLLMVPGAGNSSLAVSGNGSIKLAPIPADGTSARTSNPVSPKAIEPELTPASDADLTVYPNPTDGVVNFLLTNPKEEIIYIRLYNAAGTLLRKYAATKAINVSDLPTGFYVYNLTTNTKSFSGKFFKK